MHLLAMWNREKIFHSVVSQKNQLCLYNLNLTTMVRMSVTVFISAETCLPDYPMHHNGFGEIINFNCRFLSALGGVGMWSNLRSERFELLKRHLEFSLLSRARNTWFLSDKQPWSYMAKYIPANCRKKPNAWRPLHERSWTELYSWSFVMIWPW